MAVRSPICTVVGHVDHGKSSILDYIRGSNIVRGEAGAITQAIGASIVPIDTIKRKCGDLLKTMGMEFTIPGLLFIDTPGHEAFTTMRKRGGNLADIAVLVIDVNEGPKPQTLEAIEILRNYKTPFIIALNKTDLIPRWVSNPKKPLLQNISSQVSDAQTKLDTRLYEILGELNEKFGINADRYDRIPDFTKQIAMVPCSAKSGEGLPELLMLIAGLAQRFLNDCLECNIGGYAKGTVLEVKEDKGLGKTADVILYDGSLKVNDTIVIGDTNEPIVAKIRALLLPTPNTEMRDKKNKFRGVKEVKAATGVKISAPGIDDVKSGMPLRSCKPEDVDSVKEEVSQEIDDITIDTDSSGVIVKADTIGSLEAMLKILKDNDIKIRKASLGEISKTDIIDAECNYEKDPLTSVVLGFNVSEPSSSVSIPENVNVITSGIIYHIIETYKEWVESFSKREEEKELDSLVRPCKFEFMTNHTFRQSNPAVFGADIIFGVMKVGMPIMTEEGKNIGTVKSMQLEKESVKKVDAPKQVAVSVDGVTIGRQINEGDVLYSAVPENDFRKLKELKRLLKVPEIEVLKEIAKIKRKDNPVWGV